MLNQNDAKSAMVSYRMESTLRSVDLNLLTVFDAVMQEQNITRAAHNLGMSQPAVSNAVARLKVMFNDELFIRQGRGIQPTLRARQLFGPIRQSLQLIRNELPSSLFNPTLSSRLFKLAVCSPCDIRFAAKILSKINKMAPHIELHMDASLYSNIDEKMRYQELDFVIDYTRFDRPGFSSTEIFQDDLVVVAAVNHPRIQHHITEAQLMKEKHAQLHFMDGMYGFSELAYRDLDCHVVYEAAGLTGVLHMVMQSELITIVPRWFANNAVGNKLFQILDLPLENRILRGFLSWHESSEKDKGHIWLRDQLMVICGETIAFEL